MDLATAVSWRKDLEIQCSRRVGQAAVKVQAGEMGIRFLLVAGKPIEEPVAWYGPIVMNTDAELQQAVAEIRQGTFIKHR